MTESIIDEVEEWIHNRHSHPLNRGSMAEEWAAAVREGLVTEEQRQEAAEWYGEHRWWRAYNG